MKHYIPNQKEKNPNWNRFTPQGIKGEFISVPRKNRKGIHIQKRVIGIEVFLDQMLGTEIIKSHKAFDK